MDQLLLADKAQQASIASIANAKKSVAFLTSVLSLLGMKAVLADPPENSDPNRLAILVSDALQDLRARNIDTGHTRLDQSGC